MPNNLSERLICWVMNQTLFSFVQLGTLASLTGCISVPALPERPFGPELPSSFTLEKDRISETDTGVAQWWDVFDDPELSALVERALTQNPDLKLAAANIEVAKAIYSARLLEGKTDASASASTSLDRAARSGADAELTLNTALAASWEYDAFGRIAALIESAQFDIEAVQQARRDIAVSIAAETALAYVSMRGNQTRLEVAQSNADLQAESLGLLRTLFQNGRATRLDMERAESQYRTTLASLPALIANIETAQQRLIALIGAPATPEQIETIRAGSAYIPTPPELLMVTSPEVFIRRRPDVRAAEAEIASRLALSSADRARLFPTLTFNANIFALFAEAKAFEDSFGFGLGPALRWEGPDLRRVRADIDISDARVQVAFANYESIIVAAIAEVETALIGYVQEQARQSNLEVAAVAARRAVDLSRLRFEEGLDDFLDVIDAQRTLLDSQDRLETSRLASTQSAIAVYRALGGIWSTETFNTSTIAGEVINDF